MKEQAPLRRQASSVSEFAAEHRISEGKVWAEIAAGELESMRVGDRRLISDEQAARWRERKAEVARLHREERAKTRKAQPARGGRRVEA
jgi:hypothetical protein